MIAVHERTDVNRGFIWTPLQHAIMQRESAALELLLSLPALDVNRHHPCTSHPLVLAVREAACGSSDFLDALLRHGNAVAPQDLVDKLEASSAPSDSILLQRLHDHTSFFPTGTIWKRRIPMVILVLLYNAAFATVWVWVVLSSMLEGLWVVLGLSLASATVFVVTFSWQQFSIAYQVPAFGVLKEMTLSQIDVLRRQQLWTQFRNRHRRNQLFSIAEMVVQSLLLLVVPSKGGSVRPRIAFVAMLAVDIVGGFFSRQHDKAPAAQIDVRSHEVPTFVSL